MTLKFTAAAPLGLLGVIALAAYHGVARVVEALARGGWGLGLVCLAHLAPLALSGFAWRVLLDRTWHGRAWIFVGARAVREGASTLLPMTQVGGEFVGARVLAIAGAPASLAGASVVVDLTLEVLAQFAFTLLGLLLLLWSGRFDETGAAVAIGLGVAVPLLAGFVLAQRWGMFKLVDRFLLYLERHLPGRSLGPLAGLHDTIQGLYRNVRGVSWNAIQHLWSWVLTSGEVWLAFLVMGHPVTVSQAVVLFSLGHAARSAAFLIPSGLGAQEAGFLLIGNLYGLPPDLSLAASLAIRVRELALGVPALVGWQWLETGRALRDRGQDGTHRARSGVGRDIGSP